MRGSVFCHLWQNLIRAQSARSARTSPAIMGNKRQHRNEHIFDKISFKCKTLSNTVRSRRQISYVHILDCSKRHHTWVQNMQHQEKKCTMVIFFICVHKNVFTGCPPKKSTSQCCWSHIALAQSQETGTPCVWKLIFGSFLTKTKPDQAFPSHVHGKI